MLSNSSITYLELLWVKQYVVCITLKSTCSRRNQVPHFILPLITRCHSRIPHSRFLPLAHIEHENY